MRVVVDILDPRPFFKRGYGTPTVLLIGAALLPALHRIAGSITFARDVLQMPAAWSVRYMFVSAFVLFGIVPYIVLRISGVSLREVGVQLGDWRRGLSFVAWAFPIVTVLTLVPGALTPELAEFYPFDRAALHSWSSLLQLETLRLLAFYTSWEFFFRGALLFGLRKHLGDWMANCIQVIPSCLWHIGMPVSEIISSLIAGLCFGLLALRTQSIVWPLLLHFLIGMGLDVLIILFTS